MLPRQLSQTIPCISRTVVGQQGHSLLQASMPEHRDTVVDEGQVEMKMREAWEHEHSKDEMNIDLRGLERHYWNGTEAGLLTRNSSARHPSAYFSTGPPSRSSTL